MIRSSIQPGTGYCLRGDLLFHSGECKRQRRSRYTQGRRCTGARAMSNKRELLAQIGAYSGFTRLTEAVSGATVLLILNYHRIGDAAQTPYDSGTFSCTADELDWQVSYLKRRFPIVTLEQAADIVHGRSAPLKTSVLIT